MLKKIISFFQLNERISAQIQELKDNGYDKEYDVAYRALEEGDNTDFILDEKNIGITRALIKAAGNNSRNPEDEISREEHYFRIAQAWQHLANGQGVAKLYQNYDILLKLTRNAICSDTIETFSEEVDPPIFKKPDAAEIIITNYRSRCRLPLVEVLALPNADLLLDNPAETNIIAGDNSETNNLQTVHAFACTFVSRKNVANALKHSKEVDFLIGPQTQDHSFSRSSNLNSLLKCGHLDLLFEKIGQLRPLLEEFPPNTDIGQDLITTITADAVEILGNLDRVEFIAQELNFYFTDTLALFLSTRYGPDLVLRERELVKAIKKEANSSECDAEKDFDLFRQYIMGEKKLNIPFGRHTLREIVRAEDDKELTVGAKT